MTAALSRLNRDKVDSSFNVAVFAVSLASLLWAWKSLTGGLPDTGVGAGERLLIGWVMGCQEGDKISGFVSRFLAKSGILLPNPARGSTVVLAFAHHAHTNFTRDKSDKHQLQ